ncbi:MAG: TraB/GumN family protein [Muribaculaceae bacterium]|nr:TraB/GumN family protein [Muribaculaceae bacterium]
MNFFKSVVAVVVTMTVSLPLSAQVLFKVEGNGLKTPSYVFGTHHLAPISVIEKFGAKDPYNEASQIVGEIDMTQDQMALAQAMQPHMMAPADSTLSKVIAPEDFSVINEEFKKWAPMQGMELKMLDMLKPMAITTMVAASMAQQEMPGFNPAEQLDSWFQIQGKNAGKKVIPLETVEHQATVLFDTTPISFQADALVELLKDPSKALENTKSLTEAYNAQDLDKMLKLSEEDDEHPEFMIALLDKRNADWLTKLPAIFNDGPTFVAVGALHLAGYKGIIEGLRKLGYKETPVK